MLRFNLFILLLLSSQLFGQVVKSKPDPEINIKKSLNSDRWYLQDSMGAERLTFHKDFFYAGKVVAEGYEFNSNGNLKVIARIECGKDIAWGDDHGYQLKIDTVEFYLNKSLPKYFENHKYRVIYYSNEKLVMKKIDCVMINSPL